jgi:hypothetical protein
MLLTGEILNKYDVPMDIISEIFYNIIIDVFNKYIWIYNKLLEKY